MREARKRKKADILSRPTKKISSPDLYLVVGRQHQPGSEIEFELKLPSQSATEGGILLRGKGHLVGHEESAGSRGDIVAVIDSCELLRVKLADKKTST